MADLKQQVHPDKWPVAPHVKSLEASIIREILKITSQPGVISFAGGLPAPEMFPLDDLARIAGEVIEKYGSGCMQYSLTMGIVPLREMIAANATRIGTPTAPENVLITSGSQQGIELLARVFIDPGDYVLTENPTYVGALQAFQYYQARYATVEMDDDGMLVDEVEDKIRQYKPKMIYSVSNFQNPTGITMSLERRKALLMIAARYGIPVIDDNPYSEIRFAGQPVRTLKSMGGDEVIVLKTFSKTLTPGLRIGWMNGPVSIIRQFEKVKQCTDLHTSTFSQYIIYEYMRQGLLEPQIERLRKDYLAKRDTMIKAMETSFPEGVSWTRPDGGLFLWVTLPKHMSAKALLFKAIERKVAYVYGEPFFPNGGGANTLRLNFSNASHEGITEGIRRLGDLFKENM
ncbi:MAG: PLP-dependent aminotransferase family protein [Candidatus Zixiibacteriota bacterium]